MTPEHNDALPERLCQIFVAIFLALTLPFLSSASEFEQASRPGSGIIPLIAGGGDAGKEYPYMASLRDPSTGRHLCGGFLIAPTIVMTAAHCIENPNRKNQGAPLEVHVGRVCISCSDEDGYEVGRVGSVKFVSSWTGHIKKGGDLALLFLQKPLSSPTAKIFPQPNPTSWMNDTPQLTVAGWGLTGQFTSAESLQHVEVPFVSRDKCKWKFQEFLGQFKGFASFLQEDHICAGGDGRVPCEGDSGGPLVLSRGSRSLQDDVVVGIVSFGGQKCGSATPSETLPGVFVSLWAHRQEIAMALAEEQGINFSQSRLTPNGAKICSFTGSCRGIVGAAAAAADPQEVQISWSDHCGDSLVDCLECGGIFCTASEPLLLSQNSSGSSANSNLKWLLQALDKLTSAIRLR